MKEVIAIVKPFRAQAVLEALSQLDIESLSVCEVKGYGRQKDRLPLYVGGEYSQVYLPKIEIKVVVSDDQLETVLEKLTDIARTGRIGDGKVLVMPVIGQTSV